MRFRDTNLIQVIDHPLVNAAIARLMPRLCKFDAANSRVVFTSAKLIGRRVGERLAWLREKRARNVPPSKVVTPSPIFRPGDLACGALACVRGNPDPPPPPARARRRVSHLEAAAHYVRHSALALLRDA